MSLSLRGLLVGMLLATYVAFALYPFEWAPPINNAQWPHDGGIEFPDAGLARTDRPPAWVAAAMRSGQLTIRLRVRPATRDQTGPARIMSLSSDHYHRNFSIAQEHTQLVLRLRTQATDLNGLPDIRIADVFARQRWVNLAVMIEARQLRIVVDGKIRVRKDLPPRPLDTWDRSYRLALGNEMTGARPWLGRIARAAVYTGGATFRYTKPGALMFPALVWATGSAPTMVPFTHMQLRDTIVNLLGFVPLGWLLANDRRGRFRWRTVLFIAGVSVSLELLQLGFPERNTSINDVIFNTLGGTLGILLRRCWGGAATLLNR